MLEVVCIEARTRRSNAANRRPPFASKFALVAELAQHRRSRSRDAIAVHYNATTTVCTVMWRPRYGSSGTPAAGNAAQRGEGRCTSIGGLHLVGNRNL